MMGKAAKKPKISRRKPVQDRSQATVDAVLEATAQVVTAEGMEKASTNRIAERAGVSVGSIYQYFRNRDAILNHLIEREVGRHFELLAGKLKKLENEPVEDLVDEVLRTVINLFSDRRRLRMILFHHMGRFKTASKIQEVEDRFLEMLIGIAETRPEASDREDLRTANFVIVHSVMGTVRASLYEHRKVDPDALHRELSVMVKRYLTGRG